MIPRIPSEEKRVAVHFTIHPDSRKRFYKVVPRGRRALFMEKSLLKEVEKEEKKQAKK